MGAFDSSCPTTPRPDHAQCRFWRCLTTCRYCQPGWGRFWSSNACVCRDRPIHRNDRLINTTPIIRDQWRWRIGMSALFQRFKHLLTGCLAIPRATRRRVSISINVARQNWPLSAVSGYLFFTLVAHVCPEAVQLTALDPIPGQQLRFQCCGVLGGISQPGQDGVFFVPLHAAQANSLRPARRGSLRSRPQACDDDRRSCLWFR